MPRPNSAHAAPKIRKSHGFFIPRCRLETSPGCTGDQPAALALRRILVDRVVCPMLCCVTCANGREAPR